MSNTKMLIDATHPEETRVVVQRNGRVEEFDFESAARKLLRGNIYLAKVTRVEPSLQAAFVDYGGNRHGFLAFNEIHPDYYQIPVADRQALLDEEAAAEAELEAAADRRAEALARRQSQSGRNAGADDDQTITGDDERGDDTPAAAGAEISHIIDVDDEDDTIEEIGGEGEEPRTIAASVTASSQDAIVVEEAPGNPRDEQSSAEPPAADNDDSDPGEPASEHHEAEDDESEEDEDEAGDESPSGTAGEEAHASALNGSDSHAAPAANDVPEEAPLRPRRRPRNYKIQEVIKRRQVILVQVVKEERGNKGAALTTYLSLAGRYTVLMPNTARGGGISRKITNPQDRKRLKAIAQDLEVPEGMGLIIRTAGAARTKQEIKRDFEYLLRLWESVRELTLQSTAPSLVYEEGDLVKRSIRDLYNKDVEEVVVAGEAGYQEAAEFMRMLMPSHERNVISYKDPTPLFTRYGVERQLNAMFQPQVTLRSGGYIVINQTEALVAIDVNSGKSTREFSIEETALATNLEAAEEIARQLKLRDLAGLIVIDFIDMEEKRNNRAVERRLKDALRFDRARIQLGRISHFGLMEMSRQRLRTGVLEGSTSQCPHCVGTGVIRSTESIALAVLRGIEDAITAGASGGLTAMTTSTVALYILNAKRAYVTDMEARHGHSITILGSDRVQGANFTIERGAASAVPARRPERAAVNMNWGFEGEGEDEAPAFEPANIEVVSDDDEADDRPEHHGRESGRGDGDENGGRRGRRRRRGRGRGGRDRDEGDSHSRSNHRFEGTAPSDHDAGDDEAGDSATADDRDTGADDRGEASEGTVRGRDASEGGESSDRAGGRRRRRGRRGGRRGRERGRGDDVRETSENGADHPDAGVSEANANTRASDDAGDAGEATTQADATERPAPKPGRQKRERLWDVQSDNSASENSEAAEVAAPVSKVTVTESVTVVDEAPPVVSPQRRRHEQGSSEPRIERVVLKPGEELAGESGAAAPQRKGWWQRKFGGE